MAALQPGAALDVLALELGAAHEALPSDQVVAGAPSTATQPLGTIGTTDFGIWEISPGISTDVEADEVFVVLAGRAVVTVHDEAGSVLETLELAPGSIGRLTAGMRTTWTVTEMIRKVYVLAP